MPTQIPRTGLFQILQTNLSQETIVALLNEAELTFTKRQRDLEAKRQYPCWQICPMCGEIFWRTPAWTKKAKVNTCSKECVAAWRAQDKERLNLLRRIANTGRDGWTEQSMESYLEKMTGPNNPAWKGGVMYFKTHGNYVGVKYVRCPNEYREMARKDGYVMEHRLVVAQHLGRCLKRTEVVHHKDHDPTNNNPDNLMLFASNSQHKRYEATGRPPPLWQL